MNRLPLPSRPVICGCCGNEDRLFVTREALKQKTTIHCGVCFAVTVISEYPLLAPSAPERPKQEAARAASPR